MTDPDYRVTVTVGAHSWDVTYGDAPDYGPVLPLSFGWTVPDSVDFYPTQRNPASGSLAIVAPDLSTLADITLADPVTVDMYVPSGAAIPWQSMIGVVSQLDASVGDRNILSVSFTDPSWLLTQKVVGLGAWPLESVVDRLTRVCAEAGILLDRVVNSSGGGLLAATSGGAPTDALSAIRATLRDDADANASYGGDIVYGRPVYSYDPWTNTLVVRVAERRVVTWPAEWGADGSLHKRTGEPGALDGCAAETDGKWSRLGIDLPTYVLVDGIPFGDPAAPGAVPYLRNTAYVDGPGPTFPSAVARANLGRSLLPANDAGDPGYRTDTVRHLSYLDPDPVAGWAGDDAVSLAFGMGWITLRPTILDPIDPTLTIDGRTWIGGLLSGARLTIPPEGKFYLDLTLRPDLFPVITGTPHVGAATYDDIPPVLTYDQIDPRLTYRDLNLIGA